jgi:endonuclease/exonuclease/phosphatase family metal-dependent hydrolase
VPTAIRVATFNVLGLPAALPGLSDRAVEFCRRLDASDIDVINLQEVWWARALATIRAGLPSYPHVAWRRGIGGRPSGGLVTFSRRPLRAPAYRSFRGAVPDTGRLRFRVRKALNSLLQGVLVTRLAGHDLAVANTHVTANKDGDWSVGSRYHGLQRTQVRRVHATLRRAAAGARAVVLTGDFNIASDSPLYPAIVDNGHWHDPFAATDPTTFHVDYLPPGSVGHRIDYLLVSGNAAATDPTVLFTEPVDLADGRRTHLSDHVALAARITLRPSGGTG